MSPWLAIRTTQETMMTMLTESMKYYLTIQASGREWASIEVQDNGTVRVDVGRINIDGVKQKKYMTRTYRESSAGGSFTHYDHYNA